MTASALRAAARVGPFFELDQWRPDAGWRPLRELATDPAVLAERVAAARAMMAERTGLPLTGIEERPMASIVFLGLAARLLSPPFGALVLTGTVPALTIETLWWQPVQSGPWPLAVSPSTASPADSPAPAGAAPPAGSASAGPALTGLAPAGAAPADPASAASVETIVSDVVGPVLAAFGAQFRLSEQVLWGNVASALGGAVGTLTTHRPDLADRAAAAADDLLQTPPLRGTGTLFRPDATHPRRFFVRRSCCLFYRIPGAGTCGDCVLTPDDVRRRQWRAALS